MPKEDKGRPHASGEHAEHAERQRRLVELLDCPICLTAAASPQFLHCCGKLMCNLCLYGCLQKKDECPMCRTSGPQHSDHRFAQNVRQSLQETGADLPLGGMWIDQYGRKHEGCFKDGELDGQGKKTFTNGTIHEGCFKDGELDGQGKKTYADGTILEGCFKNGKLHGQGKTTIAKPLQRSNFIHEGEFKNGMLHGQGKKTHGCLIYEGEFKFGKLHGQGKKNLSSEIHEGEFKDGELGQGKITCAAGGILEGCFKDGKLHGQGKVDFGGDEDGAIIEGMFKNGSLYKGKKTFPDGTVCEGCFKDGKFHGQGKKTFANGKILKDKMTKFLQATATSVDSMKGDVVKMKELHAADMAKMKEQMLQMQRIVVNKFHGKKTFACGNI